jgi:hypothetical protein
LKSKALQSILDTCKKDTTLNVQCFKIEEFDSRQALVPNEIVRFIQHDEEAHCEISTTIMGVLDANSQELHDEEYYTAEYIVDKVYEI